MNMSWHCLGEFRTDMGRLGTPRRKQDHLIARFHWLAARTTSLKILRLAGIKKETPRCSKFFMRIAIPEGRIQKIGASKCCLVPVPAPSSAPLPARDLKIGALLVLLVQTVLITNRTGTWWDQFLWSLCVQFTISGTCCHAWNVKKRNVELLKPPIPMPVQPMQLHSNP